MVCQLSYHSVASPKFTPSCLYYLHFGSCSLWEGHLELYSIMRAFPAPVAAIVAATAAAVVATIAVAAFEFVDSTS